MENIYMLYALVDKNQPSEIRYIGQTKNKLSYRLSQHKREKNNSYKNNWIKKIGKENVIIILMEDRISLDKINDIERQLIKECKEIGYKLTNITDGGEGWKGMKLSETHRKKC